VIADIRPFWLIGAVCCIGSGVLVLFVKKAYQRDLDRVLNIWSLANALIGVALALRFLRGHLHEFVSVDVASTLIPVCLSLEYLGVCLLKHQKPVRAWLYLPAILTFLICLWCTVAHRNISLLYTLANLVILAVLFRIGWSAVRKEDGSRAVADVVAAVGYFGMGLVTLLIFLAAMRRGDFPVEFDYNQPRVIANAMSMIMTEAIVFPMFLMMVSDRLNRRLVELAMRDSLTGLYNRRAFEEMASRELAAAARTGMPLSLVLFDLDYFKEVNDALGHAAGDLVLLKAAAAIRQSLREEDILCRWGGDEFCALLPRIAQLQAETAVERVRSCFSASQFQANGHAFELAVSVGIACQQKPEQSLADLIHQADAALYVAKKARGKAIAMRLPGTLAAQVLR
jgi:diguanylate cyclase (GGDEF)-like protein